MEIEWDETKRSANLRKHGLDFSDAEQVFAAPYFEKPDVRRDYGEDRWVLLGSLRGRTVVMIYADRGPAVRIISLRKADNDERKHYAQAIQNGL